MNGSLSEIIILIIPFIIGRYIKNGKHSYKIAKFILFTLKLKNIIGFKDWKNLPDNNLAVTYFYNENEKKPKNIWNFYYNMVDWFVVIITAILLIIF